MKLELPGLPSTPAPFTRPPFAPPPPTVMANESPPCTGNALVHAMAPPPPPPHPPPPPPPPMHTAEIDETSGNTRAVDEDVKMHDPWLPVIAQLTPKGSGGGGGGRGAGRGRGGDGEGGLRTKQCGPAESG